MKSILEQALVHLLNNEGDKAQELMHQFIVERAKEIHESLRESDEADMEDLDSALEEEFFTEADLEDAEAVENLEDDLDDSSIADEDLEDAGMGDMEDMGMEAEMGDEMSDMEGDMEDMGGEADLGEKIDEIEEEIKNLQAEFDKLMAEFDSEEGAEGEDMDMGMEAEADMDMDMEMDAEGEVGAEDEEDFDEITEGMVDDLKKVAAHNEDGRGANGEKLSTKTTSPIGDRKAGPRVLASKNTVGHTGFELEKAPSKKEGADRGRKYDNNRSKATDGNAKVPATGPKAAELNKSVQGNTKSPISGRKTK